MDIQVRKPLKEYKVYGTKIYRTDKNGEINIEVDKNGKIKIEKFIKDIDLCTSFWYNTNKGFIGGNAFEWII